MISGFVVSYLDNKVSVLPNSAEGLIVETAQILFLIITYIIRI
jgi:hypothetical protein